MCPCRRVAVEKRVLEQSDIAPVYLDVSSRLRAERRVERVEQAARRAQPPVLRVEVDRRDLIARE